ncbi:hypothetical protein NUSPORA_02428 [Nucleospora cyclopteri]
MNLSAINIVKIEMKSDNSDINKITDVYEAEINELKSEITNKTQQFLSVKNTLQEQRKELNIAIKKKTNDNPIPVIESTIHQSNRLLNQNKQQLENIKQSVKEDKLLLDDLQFSKDLLIKQNQTIKNNITLLLRLINNKTATNQQFTELFHLQETEKSIKQQLIEKTNNINKITDQLTTNTIRLIPNITEEIERTKETLADSQIDLEIELGTKTVEEGIFLRNQRLLKYVIYTKISKNYQILKKLNETEEKISTLVKEICEKDQQSDIFYDCLDDFNKQLSNYKDKKSVEDDNNIEFDLYIKKLDQIFNDISRCSLQLSMLTKEKFHLNMYKFELKTELSNDSFLIKNAVICYQRLLQENGDWETKKQKLSEIRDLELLVEAAEKEIIKKEANYYTWFDFVTSEIQGRNQIKHDINKLNNSENKKDLQELLNNKTEVFILANNKMRKAFSEWKMSLENRDAALYNYKKATGASVTLINRINQFQDKSKQKQTEFVEKRNLLTMQKNQVSLAICNLEKLNEEIKVKNIQKRIFFEYLNVLETSPDDEESKLEEIEQIKNNIALVNGLYENLELQLNKIRNEMKQLKSDVDFTQNACNLIDDEIANIEHEIMLLRKEQNQIEIESWDKKEIELDLLSARDNYVNTLLEFLYEEQTNPELEKKCPKIHRKIEIFVEELQRIEYSDENTLIKLHQKIKLFVSGLKNSTTFNEISNNLGEEKEGDKENEKESKKKISMLFGIAIFMLMYVFIFMCIKFKISSRNN